MVAWFLAPIDPTRAHDIGLLVAWHGRLMLLAWAVLFPAGILAARFFKITRRQRWPEQLDNRAWWAGHLTLQYAGGLAVITGLGFIYAAPERTGTAGVHAWLGWTVAALGLMQFLGGWLRGSKGGPTERKADGSMAGDHYDMTPRRRAFERVHKSLGYVAVFAALACMFNGLWLVNAPRWMWFVLSGWWLFLMALAVVFQRDGRAVDTYQAIWGPDPAHPGNRTAATGWGVRRPGDRSSKPGPD
jgi:Eukaryotic cytochrome b561